MKIKINKEINKYNESKIEVNKRSIKIKKNQKKMNNIKWIQKNEFQKNMN